MTPYERLMAEQWPTGRFGRDEPVQRRPLPPLPERPPERRSIRPWTPEEQAQHLADLEAALTGWLDNTEAAGRKRANSREAAKLRRRLGTGYLRRHLRLVSSESRPATEAA
ncbi:hypothetical protein ACWD7T_33200 [Streptomyces sp. 900116325]